MKPQKLSEKIAAALAGTTAYEEELDELLFELPQRWASVPSGQSANLRADAAEVVESVRLLVSQLDRHKKAMEYEFGFLQGDVHEGLRDVAELFLSEVDGPRPDFGIKGMVPRKRSDPNAKRTFFLNNIMAWFFHCTNRRHPTLVADIYNEYFSGESGEIVSSKQVSDATEPAIARLAATQKQSKTTSL